MIQKKINKYRKKLRNSPSLEKSDFYQSKLSYYHKLNQSGGLNPKVKKEVDSITANVKTIVDSVKVNTKITNDLREQLVSKQKELADLQKKVVEHKSVSKTGSDVNVKLQQQLVQKGKEIEELKKQIENFVKFSHKKDKTCEAGIEQLRKEVEEKDEDMTDTLAFLGKLSNETKTLSEELREATKGNGKGDAKGEILVKDHPLKGGCGCGGLPRKCGDEMDVPKEPLTGGGCGGRCGRLPVLPLSNRN